MNFLTPLEVSQKYNISLTTIYQRIRNKHYRHDPNGNVLEADVVEIINHPLKKGRPRKENGGV